MFLVHPFHECSRKMAGLLAVSALMSFPLGDGMKTKQKKKTNYPQS